MDGAPPAGNRGSATGLTRLKFQFQSVFLYSSDVLQLLNEEKRSENLVLRKCLFAYVNLTICHLLTSLKSVTFISLIDDKTECKCPRFSISKLLHHIFIQSIKCLGVRQ